MFRCGFGVTSLLPAGSMCAPLSAGHVAASLLVVAPESGVEYNQRCCKEVVAFYRQLNGGLLD